MRENIVLRREIKHLRLRRKENDSTVTDLKKELDEYKSRNDGEVHKAFRKSEQKNRQLLGKLSEMKTEKDALSKHNHEYKDYFDKQTERMNALRNVNSNLSKKLH